MLFRSGSISAPPFNGEIKSPAEFPSSSNGQYPVVLELEEIYIKSSGIDYSPNDKIVIEPDLGAVLEPMFDSNGSLMKVNILKTAEGYTEMPLIYIETDTGYNAELLPVFKVNRVGDNPNLLAQLGEKVISVIDCVGKF